MKAFTYITVAVLVIGLLAAVFMIRTAHVPGSSATVPVPDTSWFLYESPIHGFSIRVPSLQASTTSNGATYKLDESYRYEQLGPGREISGVKFSVPPDSAYGTNLSVDSYISVEQVQAAVCSAAAFVPEGTPMATFTENGVEYSGAYIADAGAGNRYEESVYALVGSVPCTAVRYFIHYGVYENYPPETTAEFDKGALISEFDGIRRTLTIVR